MLKRWGHDFTRNREGEISKPLGQWGKRQMSMREPIKLSTTLCVFYAQSFKVGEGSYCLGDGKGMEVKFEFGKSPIFGKHVFGFLNK